MTETEIVVLHKEELKKLLQQIISTEFSKINALPPQENNEVLTTDEIIKILKISKSHLLKLRKKGLPSYNIGDSVRFNRIEVLDFISKYKSKT